MNNTIEKPSRSPQEWVAFDNHERHLQKMRSKWSYSQQLRSVLRNLRSVSIRLRDSLINLRRYGRLIRDEYDVSLMMQFVQQIRLSLKYKTRATAFYEYRLFLPERRNEKTSYIYTSWPLHRNIIRRTHPEEVVVFKDKLRFFRRCEEKSIPTPRVIAVAEQGEIAFLNLSTSLPKESIFIKPQNGMGGAGAVQGIYDNGHYSADGGHRYNHLEMLEWLKRRSTEAGPLIVQPRVVNHSLWQPFTSGALASARILTGRTLDGRIETLAATLRLPTGSSATDNFSGGGIACAIDIETGRLSAGFKRLPERGIHSYSAHPDTQQVIADILLPRWDELVDFGRQVHEEFDTVFVGWDVSLTTEGFMVLEGDYGWATRSIEIPQGAPLANTRYAVLYDEWMRHLTSSS